MKDNLTEDAEKLSQNLKEYVSARIELQKLTFVEESTRVFSRFFSTTIIWLLAILVLFFASIGLAILIGQWLENPALGFFILAAGLVVFGLIFYLLSRKWIEQSVLSNIYNMVFSQKKMQEDDDEKE
ncbi:phage holin family protein [Prolixibacter bellariivorans]|nr:phage holin family protein [Prolixibacter bellariivorans]